MPLGASRAGLMSVAVDDIPDSAVLHYPMIDRSNNTIIETLEGADGTAQGTTNVSNNWHEGYAEDGDGNEDYIELTNWSVVDFGSSLTSNWSILITTETSNGNDVWIMGNDSGPDDMLFRLTIGHKNAGEGELSYDMRDENGNILEVSTNNRFDDGDKHRIVWNKTGNNADDLEIWVDGSKQDVSIHEDEDFSTVSNFNDFVALMSRNTDTGIADDGRNFEGVLDNLIVCNDSLDSSEISDDYQDQPWV